jgi:hypothetical protein
LGHEKGGDLLWVEVKMETSRIQRKKEEDSRPLTPWIYSGVVSF